MNELTNTNIKSATPGAVLRDAKVIGLHMKVSPTKRAFYLYYRPKGGAVKERRPKIGDWPTISLDKAREIAKGWLEVVAAGGDPVAQWKEDADAPTVAVLCDRYIEEYAKHEKKSWKADEDGIRRTVKPKLGTLKVRDVSYTDIQALKVEMAARPVTFNRIKALVSKMFNLAEIWELRPQGSNPTAHVSAYLERKRKRYLGPAEAPKLAAILEREGQTYPRSVAFIYLLILTGARPDEIRRATWDQLKGNTITLREHKTDGHAEERKIFLPPQVMKLLARLPQQKGKSITGVKSPRKLWERIRDEAGAPDLRLYDLRHNFASAALTAGYNLSQIGELLGHKSSHTTKRYAHLMEEPATAAVKATADVLEKMMTAK